MSKSKEESAKELEEQIRNLQEQLKQLRDPAVLSNEENVQSGSYNEPSMKQKVLPPYKTYKKVQGTIDHGKEFEYLVCLLLALKLTTDENVTDFEIKSNVKGNGLFDDIELEMRFKDETVYKFLLQLKHQEQEKDITEIHLTSSNDFGLHKYLKSFEELQSDNNSYCILYTNRPTKIKHSSKFKIADKSEDGTESFIEVTVEKCSVDILFFLANTKTKHETTPFRFQIDDKKSFSKNFVFLPNQTDVKAVILSIKDILKKLNFQVYPFLVMFMKHWWEQNFVFTKSDAILKLVELSLSPWIERVSNKYDTEQSRQLAKIIMSQEMTVVDGPVDAVRDIWENSVQESHRNKIKKKYNLTKEDENKTLWYLNEAPLVVKVDKNNEQRVKNALEFLRKHVNGKKILLYGNVKEQDFAQWKTFSNLADIKETGEFNDIVCNFRVSLQGKGNISLKDLVESDLDITKLITTKILFEHLQQGFYIIGLQEQQIPTVHISIQTNTDVEENEKINFISAPAGMGKSTLLAELSNNTPPDVWSVLVKLRDHNDFFSEKPSDQEILNYFLESNESVELVRRVKNVLCKQKKVHFFLDGLDEVEPNSLDNVLNFVDFLRSRDLNTCLSSREHLEENIKNRLDVVPIKIRKIDETEQRNYLREKLIAAYPEEKIGRILAVIFESLNITRSRDLLTNPLQLNILAENLSTNNDFFDKLYNERMLVPTAMIRDTIYKTMEIRCGKVENKHMLNFLIENYLIRYKSLALKVCLEPSTFSDLNINIEEMENFEDVLGIFKNTTNLSDCVFPKYAHYLASEWLKVNGTKVKILKSEMFSESYRDLRQMFDILLAEQHLLHLSVIYKNIEQFDRLVDCDYGTADEGGRTVLHMLAFYGDELEVYQKMVEKLSALVSKEHFLQEDQLFQLDCIGYSNGVACSLLRNHFEIKYVLRIVR